LRMDAGDRVVLTDGKGTSAEGTIHFAERHKCNVALEKTSFTSRKESILHVCVGFTKNNSRNEWLLEKATELGVASIIPIAATRTEKVHIRYDRWHKILQSAILQSQQNYLPHLSEITTLEKIIKQYNGSHHKLIAHCMPDEQKKCLVEMLKQPRETVLLIGPEGDFTQNEVNLCIENGFRPVSLGAQRLRTETAAIAAASYFNMLCNGES
jgi:16S rRNA (uracil1498-N3)-methyltransferase